MLQKKNPKKPNQPAQEQFIAEYFANGGRKKAAADKLGIGWTTVKTWFQKDEAFRERVEEFRDMWRDQLRAVAFKRASEKSDTLLIFLLKSLEPETYDDQVRNAKYLAANNINVNNTVPIHAILVRDEPPLQVVNGAAEEGEH
jgi:hypothetical protein